MVKKTGDPFVTGDLLARNTSFFGLFKNTMYAEHSGTIESISRVTGQVITRGEPLPVQVKAYMAGTVVSVRTSEGVDIETTAAYIQGIFGVGGETGGAIRCACSDPAGTLDQSAISEKYHDAVVVGGALVTAEAIRKLIAVGARALITGGIDDIDLREFLGYDIGVAITGTEDFGITIVVTEGFGSIPMSDRCFTLLQSHEGRNASVNGATQIRAGVLRPEIIIPLENTSALPENFQEHGIAVGSPVRLIRQPYFGLLGTITALPAELQALESGSKARVVEVMLRNNARVSVPRANIEIVEE
jgi:hypothetical protein